MQIEIETLSKTTIRNRTNDEEKNNNFFSNNNPSSTNLVQTRKFSNNLLKSRLNRHPLVLWLQGRSIQTRICMLCSLHNWDYSYIIYRIVLIVKDQNGSAVMVINTCRGLLSKAMENKKEKCELQRWGIIYILYMLWRQNGLQISKPTSTNLSNWS